MNSALATKRAMDTAAYCVRFFGWWKTQRIASANPVEDAKKFKVVPPEPGILRPEEAAALLRACDPSILPGVVIGMFCGLRQAEIARLDWRAIDLASGILTVGVGIAKTSSRRTVKIPGNACAWLASYRQVIWPGMASHRGGAQPLEPCENRIGIRAVLLYKSRSE